MVKLCLGSSRLGPRGRRPDRPAGLGSEALADRGRVIITGMTPEQQQRFEELERRVRVLEGRDQSGPDPDSLSAFLDGLEDRIRRLEMGRATEQQS